MHILVDYGPLYSPVLTDPNPCCIGLRDMDVSVELDDSQNVTLCTVLSLLSSPFIFLECEIKMDK